jgi:hypothetical protein
MGEPDEDCWRPDIEPLSLHGWTKNLVDPQQIIGVASKEVVFDSSLLRGVVN